MNKGSLFPFARRADQRDAPVETLAAFLEMLPTPMVIVDERSRRIQAANRAFAELTGVPAPELPGSDLQALLPGWESGQARPAPASPENAALRLTPMPQAPKGLQVLAVTPEAPPAGSLDPERYHNFWANLAQLWRAANETDIHTALDVALKTVQTLCGAEILAVYRLLPDQPLLQRCCALGAGETLPETLPAQELVSLHRSRIWESGKRTAGTLQRAARQAGMIYLVSAPLDQERAVTGVALIGGSHLPEPGFPVPAAPRMGAALTIPVVELLAAAVTSILQQAGRAESQAQRIALQARELRLAQALEDQSQAGMIVIDPHGRIMRLNTSAERILGYTGPEVTGAPVEQAVIGAEDLTAALQEARSGQSTYAMEDVRLYRRNGEAFLARLRVLAVQDAAGEPGAGVEQIIVFIEDLSEEEGIRRQAQQLEQRALLGEVMAVFAHEVRNPINNISTGLQVMGMDLPADDPRQAAIARMLQDCDRLAELLRSVLAYARPAEYEMEPLEIGGLLRRLLDRLQTRIAAKNVQCDLHVEADSPPVLGNLRALEQVFSNLVNNALQAMEERGGHLILKVYPVSEDGRVYLEISVADTGPGISRDAQERIFQPFFTTEKNGTGLGLAIVKRIVTAHKGAITLTSFPGGTIFRVRLPGV